MEDFSIGNWAWFWLIFFVTGTMGLGIYAMTKTKTDEDFAVARKSYGPWLLVLALASTVASGATFMGIPGMAYSKGFPALWYPAIYPIGIYIGLILSVQLIKRAGDMFRSNSLPEFLGQRFNSDFLRIGFALLSLLLIYYIAAQVVAAATTFEVLLGVDYRLGVIVTVLVIGIYITIGGSHADILTDAFQGGLMLLIAILITGLFIFGVGFDGGGVSAINASLEAQDSTLGWSNYFSPGDPIFGSFILVMLMFIAHLPFAMNPHIGNKAFALKDSKQLRTFLLLVIPIGSILGFAVLGGLHARALLGPELRPDAAIPALFVELFPPALAGFLGIAILSAIVSTADGLFVSVAVIFSNDLYRKTFAKRIHPKKSHSEIDKYALGISRVATIGTVLVAIALAWNPPEFLAVLLWVGVGGIMSGAAGPLVIGSIWRRSTPTAAIASFLTGVISYAIIYVGIGWQNPFGAAGVCVILASIVMVVVSLFTKPMDESDLNEIFSPVREPLDN
ncbi:MAG: sodium:solute symporter family protein [Balneolales bacterium]|nr:sodium:solute symporter family protein [Balneolales bacterium]